MTERKEGELVRRRMEKERERGSEEDGERES